MILKVTRPDPNSNPVFDEYYNRYSSNICRDASRLGKGDNDFSDDLAQEGIVSLFELSRTGEANPYTYQAAVRRMLCCRREEYRKRVITPLRRRYTRGSK